MEIKIKWMKLNKKNSRYIFPLLFYVFIFFVFIPSLSFVMKPFTSFKKRVTIKKVKRRYRRNNYFLADTYFIDENNKRYYYEDSFIFGSFDLKGKELNKIKKGNSVIIKGYTTDAFGRPRRYFYDVE